MFSVVHSLSNHQLRNMSIITDKKTLWHCLAWFIFRPSEKLCPIKLNSHVIGKIGCWKSYVNIFFSCYPLFKSPNIYSSTWKRSAVRLLSFLPVLRPIGRVKMKIVWSLCCNISLSISWRCGLHWSLLLHSGGVHHSSVYFKFSLLLAGIRTQRRVFFIYLKKYISFY